MLRVLKAGARVTTNLRHRSLVKLLQQRNKRMRASELLQVRCMSAQQHIVTPLLSRAWQCVQ